MAYKELKLEKGEAAGLYDILGADPNPGKKKAASKKTTAKKTTAKKPAAKKPATKKSCK